MGLPAHRLAAALCIALLGAATFAGCSDDSGADESSSSTTEATTTTTEATDPEDAQRAEVVAAVEAAEDAAGAAFAPPMPNPQHQDLLATHSGPMLEERQLLASGLAASGWAIRRPEDTKFRVHVDLDSVRFDSENTDVVFLTTCVVDDGERFVVATGEVLAGGLFTIEFTDAMQRIDGVWKLTERREENRWDGEAGCALD